MIFFPDPWHKKKHHKRLIQPEFIQRIRHWGGGVLHLATDWENYAEHMLEVMNDAEGFANTQEQGIARARMTARSPSSSSVARSSATACGTCCSIAPTDPLPGTSSAPLLSQAG